MTYPGYGFGSAVISDRKRRFSNAGPGNVAKYNGIPPFSETQNYVASILAKLGLSVPASADPAASDVTAGDPSAYPTAIDWTTPALVAVGGLGLLWFINEFLYGA